MKNLYVMITTLLFCNCITIDAIDSIQDGIQKTQHLTSPHQDSDLHEISSHYDTAIVYLSEKWQLTDLEPFVYPSVFNNAINIIEFNSDSDSYRNGVSISELF